MADSASCPSWQNEPFTSSLSLVFGREHEENQRTITKESSFISVFTRYLFFDLIPPD